MTKRIYKVELPYHLSGMYCSAALSKLEEDKVLYLFPLSLIQRLNNGAGMMGPGIQITKEDLDDLNDQAWQYLKTNLDI